MKCLPAACTTSADQTAWICRARIVGNQRMRPREAFPEGQRSLILQDHPCALHGPRVPLPSSHPVDHLERLPSPIVSTPFLPKHAQQPATRQMQALLGRNAASDEAVGRRRHVDGTCVRKSTSRVEIRVGTVAGQTWL
eukprot:1787740-Rhodomonas_salina.2